MGAYNGTWQDEVLGIPSGFSDNTPRFKITKADGTILDSGSKIEIINPITQEGTDLTGDNLWQYIYGVGKPGDIRITERTDLDSNFALANGAVISEFVYPDLCENLTKSGLFLQLNNGIAVSFDEILADTQNNRFVACGYDSSGYPYIGYTSLDDYVNWTIIKLSSSTLVKLHSIVLDTVNNRYLACGENSSGYPYLAVASATNIASWTLTQLSSSTVVYLQKIIYDAAKSRYVVCGYNGSNYPYIGYASTSSYTTWSFVQLSTATILLMSITKDTNNGRYVACGYNNSGYQGYIAFASVDSISSSGNWTFTAIEISGVKLQAIIHDATNHRLVICGYTGSNIYPNIAYANDTTISDRSYWTFVQLSSSAMYLQDIIIDTKNNQYIVCGYDNSSKTPYLATASRGSIGTWTLTQQGSNSLLVQSLAYDASRDKLILCAQPYSTYLRNIFLRGITYPQYQ